MSELRYNLLTRDWVIIASERAKRPHDFVKSKASREDLPQHKDDCPFCPGNEGDLSDETFRLPAAGPWRARAVYNKYPALSCKAREERFTEGPYKHIAGFGIHEVIIEHPAHDTCIALMKDPEIADLITVYRQRYLSINDRSDIQAITIFKNHGPAAGTSLEHPHSQLVATPVVPRHISAFIENTSEYYNVMGKCLICQMIEHELARKKRIVLQTEYFIVFVPYASAAPFALSICPLKHSPSFKEITDTQITDLAKAIRLALAKLYYGLGNPDFNYVIRSSPVKEVWEDAFHWFISVIPRLTNPAGFELGSGMFINASIPEESAEFLRSVDPGGREAAK